jgi:plasmid maintenance system killer protein
MTPDACVGPYWFVRDSPGMVRLIAHRCTLADAEKFGDFPTSPHGHYDLWESWRSGFHSLTGDRRGTYSVTVKANWRLTFGFHDGAAREVNLEDYH